MMTLLGASKVFCCDKDFKIINNGGVLFENKEKGENKIIAFGEYQTLLEQNPQARAEFHSESILLPALSNPHIHFEFSNNKTSLSYGDFGDWLESVIQKREILFENIEQNIKKQIWLQIESGVGSVGAISSHGFDIVPLAQSPLRVQLFNEVIGSNPALIDPLYSNLLARLQESQKYANPHFVPTLSIHSPYSTHKILAKKVASLAKEKNMLLSVHFLESMQELHWLNHSKGFFKSFFSRYFGNTDATSSFNTLEFLELLEENKTLFIHCLYASELELKKIASMNAKIISSPRSNRLLNNYYLNLDKLRASNLPVIFATDGLSSNFSLNPLDEIRYTLFAYPQYSPNEFAKELILGVTHYANTALEFNGGEIALGKNADLALFACDEISRTHQEPLHFILHCQKAKKVYINGIGVYNGKPF
ncbi:aminofutalosine deaminase family hydrolase [Helicobacter cholecystus]|uniref:aminofutalosine deaminase family hydrolase n=1 Tax=Helicobacter cholecystus TaxID=45498 RepID=UPI00273978E9|nr:aminofutalosine deaminase family hydrolase [Helicobacter cholecystus]